MSEINNQTNYPPAITKTSGSVHERWRLIKDSIARYGVVIGGLGVIVAIALIFFYLLYVVFPLFISANAESVNQYEVPEASLGKTVLLGVEEQNEVAVRFTDTGQVIFFEVATGTNISTQALKIPEGAHIVSFSQGSPNSEGAVIYGLSDGKAIIVKHQYKVTYSDKTRKITPVLSYPMGEEPLLVDVSGAALEEIAVRIGDNASTIVVRSADKIRLAHFEKEKTLFDDEATITRTDSVLDYSATKVTDILIDKEERNLYLLGSSGQLALFDIIDKAAPTLVNEQTILESSLKITSAVFLNGDISLMIGDSSGLVSQWSKVRDKQNRFSMQKTRAFKVSDKAVIAINPEQRRKGFVTLDTDGMMGIYHSTSEREMIKERIGNALPISAAISPRANTVLVQSDDNRISYWKVENEHPEVSLQSLWQEVWYESYP
ncbi:MAG: phosphate ABC transporter permease, partial [Methylococcaceae bacterium]